MGYFHSPARSSQPSPSYRGRSSPSPHVRQNRQSATAVHPTSQSLSAFPISSSGLCGVIGGGGGAFAASSPQRQQRQYVSSPQSSPQSATKVHRHAAAPQDRKFRPIVQGRSSPSSAHHSPITAQQRSSPSSQAKKRASVSPAENKKYKMELCKNFLKGGCPFGSSCHFAHGAGELNRPDPIELVRDGKLLYICEIWASTGACPCGQRCKYLHDPHLTGPANSTAWLRLNTKPSKKEQHIVPDPDHWHRMNRSTQENPVIDPFSWGKCRPDREFNHGDEVSDTCDMVWNNNVTIFPQLEDGYHQQYARARANTHHQGAAPSSSVVSYSNIVRNTSPTSQEATTLAIALTMVNADVFMYSPTHCLNGQPCMILQTRYFRVVGGPNVVEETSISEYSQGSNNNIIVRADEVVFDSKGKRSNHSIWFDTQFTTYVCRKAKKSDKNDKNIWSNKGESSLFCMPNNEEFLQKLPATPPYMIMQPYGDDGFDLMKRILQYRIDELIGDNIECFSAMKLSGIKHDYTMLAEDLKRWKLPRTASLNHLERGEVNTPYTPSDPKCHAAKLYNSLVANIKNIGKELPQDEDCRLRIFIQISSKADEYTDVLPFIKSSDDKDVHPAQSIVTETWQDLLFGIGGKWEQSMQTAMGEAGKKVNPHCASPSSTA